MFGRRAMVACGSVLAMCAAPVGAAERYADLQYTIEVTGQHVTRNNVGDTNTTNKSRRFQAHARLVYRGPVQITAEQPMVVPQPSRKAMGVGGADYIAKMMACQQKSSNDAEAEACMIQVATAGPASERIKRCLAKSEAERNKDPMCSGGGGADEDSAPKPRRAAVQGEVWSSSDCEGSLLVNDTGSQHVVADTTPGGGPINSPTSTTGEWSGSSKRNPLDANNCSASVIVNHVTGKIDVTLDVGPNLLPVTQKLGSLTTKTTINPFAWSAVPLTAGSLVIKNAARNGSNNQFSGSWTNSGGVPRELQGQQSTPNNRFSTTTTARWTFSSK